MRRRSGSALRMLPDPPRLAPTLNRVIDSVMHPLAEERRELYALDSLLHLAVEVGDTVALSIAKTIRYNLPRVLGGRG